MNITERIAAALKESPPSNAFGDEVHVRPGEDLGDELDGDGENEFDFNAEERFAAVLKETIVDSIPGARVATYEEVGMMSRNTGLVVTTPDGTFQVTIVEDTRRR